MNLKISIELKKKILSKTFLNKKSYEFQYVILKIIIIRYSLTKFHIKSTMFSYEKNQSAIPEKSDHVRFLLSPSTPATSRWLIFSIDWQIIKKEHSFVRTPTHPFPYLLRPFDCLWAHFICVCFFCNFFTDAPVKWRPWFSADRLTKLIY